jgi:Asp-tRNA(Asn)/Glu-tRNA(Gln) amidotransferase A subunit family amidase
MIDLDLSYTPATRLAAMIRAKEVSPTTVVRNSLARIEDVNQRLNCFCFTYPEEALDRARAAEAAVMRGDDLGPLHGVPIAIKDLTPTKGKRTAMGSHIREHWVPDFDAIIVERLLGAGAILVGKTATPEYAHSFFTHSPLWGVTRNPWNPAKTPGGSSGGSAAAVAAGCLPLAEGSDMGGSVRGPAAFCGIVGLKPSFGRIPFDILPSTLDHTCHFGPLARTADDAALFLSVTQGPDERDMSSQPAPGPVAPPLDTDLRGMKLAFSPDLGYCVIDGEVAANARAATEILRGLGAEVREVDPGLTKDCTEQGWAHWAVNCAALLGEELPKWREKMDPHLVRLVEDGLAMDAVAFKRSEFVAADMWRKLRPILAEHEALLCPTMALPAPDAEATDSMFYGTDAEGRYHSLDLTFPTILASRCPALSVPSGMTANGLPTGLQIVGRRFDDLTVLRIGAALEGPVGWPELRPPI